MPAPSTSDPLALPYSRTLGHPGGLPGGGFMQYVQPDTWLGAPPPPPGGGRTAAAAAALHSNYATIRTLGKPNLIQGDRWEQPAGDGLATKVGVGGGFRKFTNDTANSECENTGIGSFPLPTDLRCYMCGVRYADETSRKREGAECEHVMPFWLLFLLIGINHPSYIKWRNNFFIKYKTHLNTEGIYKETFIAYQEWLWGGAYKWSCWPCNRLKNNCGYINIDMNTDYRLSVLNSITTTADLRGDPPVACYTGNVNDHFLALMLSTQSYCRSWRKLYTPQIQGPAVAGNDKTYLIDPTTGNQRNFSDLRTDAKHANGAVDGCNDLFDFFTRQFKKGTEELIKKLAIMNMPIARRRGLDWNSNHPNSLAHTVPDSQPGANGRPHSSLYADSDGNDPSSGWGVVAVGYSANVAAHSWDSAAEDWDNTTTTMPTGQGIKPDIEPQQFFSVVTLIARAIILEKTSLTSFTGHFASIITNAFTSLGDTITGTVLGGKLGGGGNSNKDNSNKDNKDNNFINQKGGAIHYSGDGEHAGQIVTVEAMDWTRGFMSINLEYPSVIGMPLGDGVVSIIRGEIPDAEAMQITDLIHIGNSNEEDIWGIHLYKYVKVISSGEIVYKLYPVSQRELMEQQSEIEQYFKTKKSQEIQSLGLSEDQLPLYESLLQASINDQQITEDEIYAIISLYEISGASEVDRMNGAVTEGFRIRFGEAAKYVTRALRVSNRAKYTILLRRRNTKQIIEALREISSEEELTDFTTALCLHNLRVNREEDSHKILQFINEFQDRLGPQFYTDVETIKNLILELVVTMGAGPGGRADRPIYTEGDTSLIESIIKVNDIVKRVDGSKNKETYRGNQYDAGLYDKIDDITEGCFRSAYRLVETQATPDIKSATILYKAMQDSLLSEIRTALNGIGTHEEAVVYILELYKNSCYLEGIYSLLDNMSDETMLSFIQPALVQVSNAQINDAVREQLASQINDAVREQLARGPVGYRPSIELLLLFNENVQSLSTLYDDNIVKFGGTAGRGLNITQMIGECGQLKFEYPFLSKDLIDNLELGEVEDEKTKILNLFIMFFNAIYEGMDSMMDWRYVKTLQANAGAYSGKHNSWVAMGITSDTAAQLLMSIHLKDGNPHPDSLDEYLTPHTIEARNFIAKLLTIIIDKGGRRDEIITYYSYLGQLITTIQVQDYISAQLLISIINNMEDEIVKIIETLGGIIESSVDANTAAKLLISIINKGFDPGNVWATMSDVLSSMEPQSRALILSTLIRSGGIFKNDPEGAVKLRDLCVVAHYTPNINELISLGPSALEVLLTSKIEVDRNSGNKYFQLDPRRVVWIEQMQAYQHWFTSLSPPEKSGWFELWFGNLSPQVQQQYQQMNQGQQEEQAKHLGFQQWLKQQQTQGGGMITESGAPKCQPCSTNEVYKPPKKKSIRKKKRKTNKKSKKKIIKKSPKYSKRKSIKKKTFKKSKRNTLRKSKRNTLKKSKRKSKR